MKIILFRSNNIFDSRVNKYHNYYERAGLDYVIVGWDRGGKGWLKEHYDFFHYQAEVDAGGLKGMRNHFKWMVFVYRYLKKHRDVTTIHACDLNVAFPAALFKALHKKDVTLIFDACDWFSSNYANNKFLKGLFGFMEKFAYKRSDKLIICEPEREKQIQFKLREKPLVMPNIPDISTDMITPVQEKYVFQNGNPTLAYLGGFSDDRFLLEMLTLAETEPFNLLIAGYGNKDVIAKCESLKDKDNVRYFGRIPMEEGLNMENASDIIYAMYCKVNQNNIFAAPNKFYEALLLGKPLITTKGTIVEPKVVNNGIGWAVEEDIEELRQLLRNLKKEDIQEKGKKSSELWEKKFKNYLMDFFDNAYAKIIK